MLISYVTQTGEFIFLIAHSTNVEIGTQHSYS